MRFETLADWLAWQETLHPQAIDLGLSRVSSVLERMALAKPMPLTLSVGGTNGKGSCVAMLERILREAGYRVGAYTSPHLLRYNERISVDGQPVDDARIMQAFHRIETARQDTSLSFFEFGTLAALDIFNAASLDIQILEVGLGGRLDAVNSVDADIALIASIDIDHQEWLGHTREAIGQEKAGIFRTGRPAVIADPEVPASVIRLAREQAVPLYRQGQAFGFRRTTDGWDWWNEDTRFDALPLPAIPGEHQLMNAAAVLQCLHLLPAACAVDETAIRRGLERVHLAGRFQWFAGDIPVLVDVAHNPQSVRILAEHLRRFHAGRRIQAVFAVMRDKDIPGMLQPICDVIDNWYLAPLHMPRAATPDELSGILQAAGASRVQRGFASVSAACQAARVGAQPGDLMLVFGSFFLVSDFLAQTAGQGG